ncbi:cytochrome P450 CYP12A2-like isoform X2 [Homalodisca vitripennis]|uniref:cytochrome P450 CYP12A2-like isoform X2 n=1 Tax=Homalodisca vitripennis TaxID=197043 RepID=UPI001EEB7175|nr:cytochrome P450 CYP12A2-like isoform X2 [Homalodisca vitripennis]
MNFLMAAGITNFQIFPRRTVTTRYSEWENALPFEQVPGPKSFPLIGNVWRFLPIIGDLYKLDTTELHVELNRKFGDIVKLDGIPGKGPLVFLSDPRDLAKVFHSEGEYPVRDAMQSTKYYREHVHPYPYTKVGHLVDQGCKWKKFRTRVNQLMMKQSNIDMYQEAVTEVTNDFVHRILQVRNCSNETDKDFIGELRKWALEVLGVVALDHRFGCLQGTLSREAQEIMKAVENFHQVTYSLDTQPLPLWQYFSTSDFSTMVSALDHLHGVSEEYVARAERRLQTKEEIRSILEKLVGQGADGKDVAVVLAVDMFLAGVEIIAAMSATLLYALAKHPESQQWLFEHISFRTHQQALPFLQAFIKETMRLWPVAIGTLRTPDKDLVLSGYRIPKGSLLLTSNYIMCRNPKYFKNPLHFRPERWLSSERLEYSQFAFAPFGIGVRSCVGRRIAMLELETFLLNIVNNFKIEYNYEDVKFESKFLNVISSPLQLTFIDRASI